MSGSMTILHQLPYKPRGKATHSWARATFDFSEAGCPGANLATALGGTLTSLDGKEDLFFEGCGQKVTYHILCPPHDHFHVQKWVKRLKNGCKMPITREKVVCQVAEVVMAFIESISDGKDSLGLTPKFNGVPFDEIYLLRLEQFGSSFQPVLGRLRVEEQPTSLAQPTISLPLAQPYPPHLSAAIDHRFGYPAGSSSGSVAPANMPCQVYPVDPFSYFGSGTPFDRNPALWWSGESGSGASQQEGYGAQDAAPDPRLCFSRLNIELPFAPDNFQDPGGSPTYGTFGFWY